ncbi:MAG TPA: hydrogenase maturation protease [Streptosporangiaceae bacterium]
MTGRTLIAGIGNIFFGDDGFGVEVARRLAGRDDLPAQVTVADYGIAGLHLAYDLCDGYERAILVDATPRGGAPGTVYVIEPDQPDHVPAGLFDAHGMQPEVVLGMIGTLGGAAGEPADGEPAPSPAAAPRMLIVGCEPASAAPGIGLSEPVAAAVDSAVTVVLDLVSGRREGVSADVPRHTR